MGPLAVTPAAQRKGLGQLLVREGFNWLRESGFTSVFVLGDPAYYSRFGFASEDRVMPPYPLADAWRSA